MRHASTQTTMNIYGKAMTDRKGQANSKVVEIVLNSSKSGKNRRPQEADRGYWELMGGCGTLQNPPNQLRSLVAG
jgi:hypothetical protein